MYYHIHPLDIGVWLVFLQHFKGKDIFLDEKFYTIDYRVFICVTSVYSYFSCAAKKVYCCEQATTSVSDALTVNTDGVSGMNIQENPAA